MALTATSSPLGFDNIVGYTTGKEEFYVPGDPGDVLTRGHSVTKTAGEGFVDICATDEVSFGTVRKTVTMAAATTGHPNPESAEPCFDTTDTLALINPAVAAGIPIRVVTFSGQVDDTVASYDGTVPEIIMSTGCGADHRSAGAIVYIYDGPGAGQIGTVASYAHSGIHLVLDRKFEVAPTSASSIIVLSGEAATYKGIGFFGRIGADNNNLTADNGADNGMWMVFADFRKLNRYLHQLTLPVIPASSIYAS